MTEDTKQKIRESIKKTIKECGGHWLKGTRLSKEHKNKIKEVSIKKGFKPPVRVAGKKYPHSEETKLKISKAKKGKKVENISRAKKGVLVLNNRGEKHYAWKGGKNKRALLQNRTDYKKWRNFVFERDDYTCQCCGERGGELNADHVMPYSTHPDLIYEILNGRTLCVECHRKTDTYGWKMVHILRKEEVMMF